MNDLLKDTGRYICIYIYIYYYMIYIMYYYIFLFDIYINYMIDFSLYSCQFVSTVFFVLKRNSFSTTHRPEVTVKLQVPRCCGRKCSKSPADPTKKGEVNKGTKRRKYVETKNENQSFAKVCGRYMKIQNIYIYIV